MPDPNQRLDEIIARSVDSGLEPLPLRISGLLFENALHLTMLLDLDGTILLANAAAEEVMGGPRTRWQGVSFVELFDERERQLLRDEFQAWRDRGMDGLFRCEHSLDSGGRLLGLSLQALRGARGEPIACIVAAQDITERVVLQRRLASTAALHDGMLETATDPIVVIDVHGVIRAASRSVETMFAWPRAELVGQNVSVLMTEPHRSAHDGYLRHYLESGHSAVLGRLREFTVRRRDGHLITCELSAFRIDLPGERSPVFCGFFRDASERKRVQAQEAAHLAALGAIAEASSMLSHEIKNPITGLRHALRALAKQLGATEQEILGELVERMQRLERRIRRSLAFVRSPKVHREACDLAKLAREVVSDLRQAVDAKGAKIEVIPESGVAVELDAPLIQDVLGNLVLNALDAIAAGGRIRIRMVPAAAGVELRVEDDGPGIPPSIRETLFQPFVTSKPEGTGLGLMICKRIVEAHGGHVRAGDSELGGAAFVVTLPQPP